MLRLRIVACITMMLLQTPQLSIAQEGERELQLTPAEVREISRDAYIYGFPLVDNYRVLHAYFVEEGGVQYKVPWNTINNEASVYTPEDTAIQTPNSDTPYSQLGTYLRPQPLVISVPEVDENRYYSLHFIDLYTFNYAFVGSRSTGNSAGRFLLVGPDWEGEKPDGITSVIKSETELGLVLFRTQLFNADDLPEVAKIQAGYKVQKLSEYLGEASPSEQPIDFISPLTPEEQRTSPAFFDILNFALSFCPTHPSEVEMMERFAKIGVGGGKTFPYADFNPEIQQAVRDGMADAWKEFDEFKRTQLDTGLKTSADGFGTREFLDEDYLARMASAVLGIYGLSKEEAVYPAYYVDSDGQPLNGEKNQYTIRFGPDSLPPVRAFWSLTMYELPSSLLADNPIDRYLINSPMLPYMKRDDDGGLTIYIQNAAPEESKQANWLPAPAGDFWMVMRLYWPGEEILDGRWKAPELKRVGAAADTESIKVTVDNFVRAESDLYLTMVAARKGVGVFDHNRVPTPIDDQTVIRMNRDTLYSSVVLDLQASPATVTLPDSGDRFLSMQVINQDHLTPLVAYDAGSYELNVDNMGSRYVIAAFRILADPDDPDDLAIAHELQDSIRLDQRSKGEMSTPKWDMASQTEVRNLLIGLGAMLPDTRSMFGTKEDIQPVRHLIGSAMAWGGNPDRDALYLNVTPKQNDGKTVHRMVIRDVPVDGFWSVSIYNAEGFFEANPLNAYSINSVTAERESDGSVIIQFGDCEAVAKNCLPTPEGWNYMVRLYRPQQVILDGAWEFPKAEPVR